jgi:hypothetical protein
MDNAMAKGGCSLKRVVDISLSSGRRVPVLHHPEEEQTYWLQSLPLDAASAEQGGLFCGVPPNN